MKRENPSFSNQEELHWLAFCYVADELDPVQREAFEVRLAEQQDARDAVEEVFRLNVLMHAAISEPCETPATPAVSMPALPAVGHRSGSWKFPVSLLAAAASLLFVLFMLNPFYVPQPAAVNDEALAEAWANTLVSLEQDEFEEWVAEDLSDVTFNEEDGWLIAAIDQVEEDGGMPADPMEMHEDDDLPCLQ